MHGLQNRPYLIVLLHRPRWRSTSCAQIRWVLSPLLGLELEVYCISLLDKNTGSLCPTIQLQNVVCLKYGMQDLYCTCKPRPQTLSMLPPWFRHIEAEVKDSNCKADPALFKITGDKPCLYILTYLSSIQSYMELTTKWGTSLLVSGHVLRWPGLARAQVLLRPRTIQVACGLLAIWGVLHLFFGATAWL